MPSVIELKTDGKTAHPAAITPAVKFCGLRTAADVRAVNQVFTESGGRAPKYAGFVCVPGRRRFVSAAQVMQLRSILAPGVRAVGVFQNAPLEEIMTLAVSGGIDLVQLHGSEDAQYLAQLRKMLDSSRSDSRLGEKSQSALLGSRENTSRIEIIQAFGIETTADLVAARASSADYLLLDAVGGGSGTTFDWRLLRDFPRPYFLAGGLRPQNVAQAIAQLAPFGLDVASGIENSAGVKELSLMQDFARAALQTWPCACE